LRGAPQECHTTTDRRTENYNKINVNQDRYLSSSLSGSVSFLLVLQGLRGVQAVIASFDGSDEERSALRAL